MEGGVLQNVVQKLNEIPALKAKVLKEEIRLNGLIVDAKIRIERNDYRENWNAEVKNRIVPATIPQIIPQIKEIGRTILFADYITTKAKEILRENNIAYADTAGNVFIDHNQLYIFIQTNKSNRTKLLKTNRAFNKTGLKVVFQLLIHPEFVNKPFRFLGDHAQVAIDTVGKVLKDLREEKYIIPIDDRFYKWNKREELITRWVDGYNRNLRPHLKQKVYKPRDPNQNWKNLNLPDDTYWGGANAAEELTDYLIADRWTVYTGQNFEILMKNMQWIPHPNGNIQVFEKFWNNDNDNLLAPNLITYADLLAIDNPRYLEAARKLYEQYIEEVIN